MLGAGWFADYGIALYPDSPEMAGQMFLTERDGEIARLVIRYDR